MTPVFPAFPWRRDDALPLLVALVLLLTLESTRFGATVRAAVDKLDRPWRIAEGRAGT